MATYDVSKTFRRQVQITDKVAAVMRMFGLTVEQLDQTMVTHSCKLKITAGDIVYISGPSGAGKSVLLAELEKAIPEKDKINLNQIKFPGDRAVIDCIAGDFLQSLRMLSVAGLNDVFCVLNRPTNLSEGEKYRFQLAMAISARKKFVFADEFCNNLDSITAAVIAYNIRRFAKRHNVTFILAAASDDILADLEPDVIVSKELAGTTQVIYKK